MAIAFGRQTCVCLSHEHVRLEWPVNLRPMLAGSTNITFVQATTEEVVTRGAVSFDDSRTRTAVVDGRGRWLAINKWGNLGVPLESQKKGARKRLLNRAHRLIADLGRLGFRPFLSSGPLLGAIRNGRFLPHDDDIDLGNVTDTQHPADLVIESERLERALAGLGYTVVRQSVIVDIGAGTSRTAQRVHESGRSTIVADFSLPALFSQAGVEGTRHDDAVYLNLNDRHRVLEFALERIADGRQTSLVFEHVLEGLDGDGRENAVLLMHWILSGTAVAVVTFDTDLPDDHTFEDPTSWHLPVDKFVAVTNAHDLAAEIVRTIVSPDDRGRTRVTAHVIAQARRSDAVKEFVGRMRSALLPARWSR